MPSNEMDTKSGTFAADYFQSSPFLQSLAIFVRSQTRQSVGREADATSLESSEKQESLTSLTPEVLAQLLVVRREADSESRGRPGLLTTATFDSSTSAALVEEDWSINWPCVRIAPDSPEGGEESLVAGARLAVACHAALRRREEDQQLLLQTMERLPGLSFVVEWIVRGGSDDETYVALCVCLTVLEKALFDIDRRAESRETETNCCETASAHAYGSGATTRWETGDASGMGGEGGTAEVAPAMILRDLIASPTVKKALPEQMMAILRLLLLPLGFNIRNLVWHGFLAPHELPKELASLILMVTLSIYDSVAQDQDLGLSPIRSLTASESRSVVDSELLPMGVAPEVLISTTVNTSTIERSRESGPPEWQRSDENIDGRCTGDAGGTVPQRPENAESFGWALDTFDDCLACPPALTLALELLLSEQHCGELCALVRHSAFLLPGREGMALLALRALAEGRHALFLVAVLPLLEHGLRCIFSCANASPEHLFAHLRQYYSTLDGFGQRARHQLLLDQEMSGCPGRPNLLLAALGPGLSACLLDLFMMSAGPNLRGKIAHAEIDIFSAFPPPPGTGGDEENGHVVDGRTGPGTPGVVALAAVVFLVLCWRYDPALQTAHGGGGSGGNDGDLECHRDEATKGSDNSRRLNSDGFEKALRSCEAHCSEWVPRFHPHELLEVDLQASWAEFDLLALVLEARTVSVERLPEGKDIARMSVAISPHANGDAVAAAAAWSTTRGVTVQEQTEDEDRDKRTLEGNYHLATEEGAARGNYSLPVFLTVIDNASRLMPSVDEAEMGAATPPSAGTGGRANKKQATAAQTGLFPTLFRVNRGLREHGVALGGRFERTAAVYTRGQKGECPPSSSYASLHRVSGAEYQRPELPASNGETSAFATYTHSRRCVDFAGCSLTCLEGGKGSSLEGAPMLARALPQTMESSAAAAAATKGVTGATIAIGPTNLGAEDVPTSQSTDASARSCRGGHNCDTRSPEDGGKRSVSARDADGPTPPGEDDATSMQANGYASPQAGDAFSTPRILWRRNREPRRISPPTNVVTAAPLPQIACMAGICRVCADVARGIRDRINELEALMTSGTARSGHRRTYAATLSVAPTLLRFLALTQAAVEAFVIEWDGQELQGAGGTCTTTAANNSRGKGPPSSLSASTGAPVGAMPVGPPPPPLLPGDDDRGSRAAVGPSPSLTTQATRTAPPGAKTRLAFLRRLAAVNGALGLCVLQGAGGGGGGAVQRKGYVQALGELASFLETKAARRGFAGL